MSSETVNEWQIYSNPADAKHVACCTVSRTDGSGKPIVVFCADSGLLDDAALCICDALNGRGAVPELEQRLLEMGIRFRQLATDMQSLAAFVRGDSEGAR